ncbi:MAG: 4Fe-4S binding protein [candidate division WOR-3 bacterium]
MKRPKLRELTEAIRAIFTGPFTSKFPKKPSPAAIQFRGKIEFNFDKCIMCGACVEVCPANARKMVDDKVKRIRRNIHYQDKCIYCGQCVAYCTTKEGIRHTQEYDLSQTTREGYENFIEKELILCEICGGVITTRDHLRWIAHRVGELAYSNPNLSLVLADDLKTEDIPQRGAIGPYRSDQMRYLCPTCRRSVYLHEIWGY